MTMEMQMARVVEPGWTNLAIGEPHFLQHALAPLYPDMVLSGDLQYPPAGGLAELREAGLIPELMPMSQHPFMVIANGAKQALAAAMYGLAKVHGVKTATARAPYWPSFPTLAKQAGLEWNQHQGLFVPNHVSIITFPNNPTGTDCANREDWLNKDRQFSIWDAVYASETYGFSEIYQYMRPQSFDVTIGSASKLWGLSGLRLGWATFAHQKVAEAAEEFIELTTSGASVLSQRYFLALADKARKNPYLFKAALGQAERYLDHNASVFNYKLRSFCDKVEGLPVSNGGMFAWFKPKDAEGFASALNAAKIKVLDGAAMGVPGWIRMNLGLAPRQMGNAIDSLEKELEKELQR